MEEIRDLNRLEVVLADKKRTNKWLTEQLDKDPVTITKWCTNTCMPDMIWAIYLKIVQLLVVDVNELWDSAIKYFALEIICLRKRIHIEP